MLPMNQSVPMQSPPCHRQSSFKILCFQTYVGITASVVVNSMVLCSPELRQRQEMMMRNQMAMAPQILAQGQQRLQGVPTQFEPRFMDRSALILILK